MVGALLFAFLVGLAVGVLIGRRAPRPDAAQVPGPAPALPGPRPAPTKRGRKAGLTEESFTPSDDILEKLRLAAEGELDPSVLAGEPPAKPRPEEPQEKPPAEVDPRLAEAERRILERLRQQEAQDDESGGTSSRTSS